MPRPVILVLLFSSIFLHILSFPNFLFSGFQKISGYIAFIAFVPYFYVLYKAKLKLSQAFLLGLAFGFFSFLGIIYWISQIKELGFFAIPALFVLSLYLGIYPAIFSVLFVKLKKMNYTIQLFLIPLIWVILEYIRAHFLTGFPWGLIGYSQYMNLSLIQISSITGIYGISFLVIMANVSLIHIILPTGKKSILISLIIFFLVFLYGSSKMQTKFNEDIGSAEGARQGAEGPRKGKLSRRGNEKKQLKVALLQGNINQSKKWNPEVEEFIYKRYKTLAKQAKIQNPDLIIWPETSAPSFLLHDKILHDKKWLRFIKRLVKETNAYHLIGTLDANLDEKGKLKNCFNSAILLSPDGTILDKYYKIHLVPFGEFVPFMKFLKLFERPITKIKNLITKDYTPLFEFLPNFTKGKKHTVFETQIGKFSVLICYEIIFPELVRKFKTNGAEFLITITNDGWYGRTAMSYQHTSMAVFRAIENRCYVLRAANTGVSCIIDPVGNFVEKLDIFCPGIIIYSF